MTYKTKYNKKYGFDKDTEHNINDIKKTTKIPKKYLQEIYNRGIGAYKTNPESVRPMVTSKEQWAFARVYAFIIKAHNKMKYKPQDTDIYDKIRQIL